MKKIILITSAYLITFTLSGQMGINTKNPQGAFHIDAAKNNASNPPTAQEQIDDFVVDAQGKVGIGTISPTGKIDIVGTGNQVFRLRNTEDTDAPLGKILTSNANGYGSWQTPGTSYAILGKLTTNNGNDYYYSRLLVSSDNNTNYTSYTGMFIDLPKGTYQINFTLWLSLDGYVASSGAQRFSSVFLSKSIATSDISYRPTYTTGIKSVIMNSTYAGSESDYYGSGAIPITVTENDILTLGNAHTGTDGSGIAKAKGYVRYYLWVYVSPQNFTSSSLSAIKTRTQSPGFFGPYTQLYALPFAIAD